jgi:DNA N-6-adenine-methyltransferase (Dam)
MDEYVANRVTEFGATRGANIRHPVYNSDRSLLPSHFRMLEARTGLPFTIDACANDSGDNALCDKFFSKTNSFLLADITNEHVWCNPPFIIGLKSV